MGSERQQRWYDEDPVLARAMAQLHDADDRYQAQIALNIIKIIVEHQMESDTDVSVGAIEEPLHSYRRPLADQRRHRRWYDVHETLSSAIQLLQDCPDDLQQQIIPTIAAMIEKTLTAEPPEVS